MNKKTTLLFRTLLLAMMMLGGASSSRADNVNIPQDLGSYINWSNATTTSGTNESTGNADGGNLGSTNSSTVSSFTIINSTEQDYILSLRSSSQNCEATWSITLTNSTSQKVLSRTFVVTSTSTENWYNYSTVYSFMLSSLPADTYTLTFKCTGIGSGSYAGNLKYLAFCKASDYQNLPLESSSENLDLGKGTATTSGSPRYVLAENTIGWIPNYAEDELYPSNAFLDGYFVNNTTSGKYTFKFFLSYANKEENKAKVKVTITDVRTGYNEIDGVEYDVTYSGDDKSVVLANPISAGMKKIRFDFACKSSSCNFKNVTFVLNEAVTASILSENDDYTPAAASNVHVTLTRTLKANKWNTIVLPFDMTAEQITNTFGAGTLIAQMTGISGTTVTFSKEVTSMNAHEPYLIFVRSDFSSGTINNVTITAGTPEKTSVSGIDLIGSYNALTEIPYSNNTDSYYFISNNELYRSSTSDSHDTMRGTRAYFKVPGATAARLAFVIDDEETTGLQQVATESQQQSAVFYDLQGRRVKTPTKGLYIKNGKKIIM